MGFAKHIIEGIKIIAVLSVVALVIMAMPSQAGFF